MRRSTLFQQMGCARRRTGAGFTLVELMVAMTGGLFLSIVVFALSRDTAHFYQRERRMANATLAGVTGFQRLSSDVARAGLLSTPNIQQDPAVCVRPDATWPAALQNLRALVLETNPAAATTEVGAAGITPWGVLVSGALNTPEVFISNAVAPAGSGAWQIDLNLLTPSAARAGLSAATTATATNQAVLDSIFMSNGVGKIVRLRLAGKDQFGVVQATQATPGKAVVTLAGTPNLVRVSSGGAQCGIDGHATEVAISVIDLVRYNIRSMVGDSNYATLFALSGIGGGTPALPYEPKRAELVRVEVGPNGQEIPGTQEIVGEYAVDLQVSAWGATSPQNPTLVAVQPATINGTYNATQLLRGVHLRFSVRSREADRDADVTSMGGGANRYRMPVGPGGTAPYARVRTFQSDIPLRNLESSNWL